VRLRTNEVIKAILDDKFRKLPEKIPRDKIIPYRVEIEGRLRKLAAEARKQGGLDLYLPIEFQHGAPTAASFVVSEGSVGPSEQIDPEALIAVLVDEGGEKTRVTIDGVAGLRTEQIAQPDPSREVEYGSRRVDYILPAPGQVNRWLLVAFSTVGGGDPGDMYAKLLVELFDAIMSTFRWTKV
jgi:hypothetical protein